MRELVGIVAEESIGMAAGATTQVSEDSPCDFELLLLPLAHRGTVGVRMLGMLAPLQRPYWLGSWPAQPLHLVIFQFVGQPSVASLAVRISPAPRRTLKVIDGGARNAGIGSGRKLAGSAGRRHQSGRMRTPRDLLSGLILRNALLWTGFKLSI